MKVRGGRKFFTICLCFALIFLTAFFVSPANFAYAENFTTETRTDENFSMTMTATSRQNSSLPLDLRMDETEKIQYICFQWRDLSRLNFRFDLKANDTTSFGEYEFKVTHFGDDRLVPLLDSDPETLYHGQVGDFARLDFFYYIDGISVDDKTPTSSAGHGFGLYKFDFVYWHTVSEKLEPVALGNSIYVAVLPDTNIQELLANRNISIVYSVSPSKHLVNVYNLSLSSNVLRYVKPDRITWVAYGKGTDNVDYCLTQEMQDMDIKLANCKVIWENRDKEKKDNHGTSFLLDTNEIEGIWSAYCVIKDADGNELLTLPIDNLSTIKVPPKNYMWLVLLIIGLLLLLLLLIALIIIWRMKKKEKVW